MHGIGFKPDDVELTELRLHSGLKKQGDNIILTVLIPLSRVIIRTTSSSSRNTPQF
jgi:hypothetical protein